MVECCGDVMVCCGDVVCCGGVVVCCGDAGLVVVVCCGSDDTILGDAVVCDIRGDAASSATQGCSRASCTVKRELRGGGGVSRGEGLGRIIFNPVQTNPR